jgi:2-oxoisovalerate dehydrogenase E1 component alpha subunit
VGIALASKLRGEKDATIVYFGDGATSKGDFHEALNFAGVHRLPVVFFCENNGYAISVPIKKQMAIAQVSQRAAGYGFPGVTVDGNDALAVYAASKEALQRARGGEGPTLIEAVVQRLVPHSSDDDQRRYRSQEEIEAGKLADPVPQFKAYLEKEGLLTAEQNEEINKRVAKEVDDATDFAEKSPYPEPEEALTRVYSSVEG